MEYEETDKEHDEGDDPYRLDEVAPPLVNRPVRNEIPGEEGRDKLPDRPPYRQQCQQGTRGIREELEEHRSVNREISADSGSQASKQETDAAPTRSVGSPYPEDASNKQGEVERDAPTDDVGAQAPEEAAYTQTSK